MTIRTKAELRTEVSTLLADNTTGLISAGDVRSVVDDMIDSLSAPATGPNDDIYFGTSADATPQGSELTIGAVNGVGTVPAYAGDRYLLIARLATEDDITSVTFSDDASNTNQVGAFTEFASTVVPTGETLAFTVWVSNQFLTQAVNVTVTVS